MTRIFQKEKLSTFVTPAMTPGVSCDTFLVEQVYHVNAFQVYQVPQIPTVNVHF